MPKVTGTAGLTKLILAILFVLTFAYLIIVISQVSFLEKSVERKQKELKAYQKEGLAGLNREKVRLERQLKAIESSYEEMTGLVAPKPKSRMPKDPGDPLKFKEELYKVQNKLKEDGKSLNFEFPFWLGFDKYEHDIPTAADLPMRVKQLDIIKEVGTLMLNNKISTITAVEFGDIRNISAEGEKEIVYKEFPLKIGFVCANADLMNFLHALTISEIAFKVDYMKLKASEAKAGGKGDLSVELIITAAVFP
jgi:Tfp pilus assembly protein PilO